MRFPRFIFCMRFVALTSVVILSPSYSAHARTEASPSAVGSYRMKLVKVYDREGWSQPVEAYRILIPSDWKIDGWVRWRQDSIGCPDNIIDVGARAIAPDGVTGFEIFPPYNWQWVQDPQMRQALRQQEERNVQFLGPSSRGCPMIPANTADDVLRNYIVPQYRKGARLVASEPLPDVARATDAQVRANFAPLLQAGLLAGYRVDAGRVRLASTVQGRAAEEYVSATLTVVQQSTPSMTAAMQGQMGNSFTYGMSAYNFIATRAPQGQLGAKSKLFASIVESVRPNQMWLNAIQQVVINMKNTQIKGAADRAAIWRKAQQEISAIHNQVYKQQQAVNDRLAAQFSQTIRGVETYVDPTTKEAVELTSGYKQYWTNGQNEYILSDDSNFNPSVALKENWRLMQRPGK
jgi:hypothetical protein